MKKCIKTVQQVIKCCNMPIGIVAILLLLAPQYLFATTFTVSSTADSGPGTLRQAIINANADVNTPHTINFSIAAGSTITLAATALPNITRTMVIDATTTTGWTNNAIGVTIDATSNTGNQVFNVVNVPGFEIYGFQIIGGSSTSFGILINGDNADNFKIGAINKRNVINRAGNTVVRVIGADNGFIQNNYIGCDVTGTIGYYSAPASGTCLQLMNGAEGNTIGGSTAGQGNLIAGGTGFGLIIGINNDASPGNSGCSNNVIYGNRIGGPGTLQIWSCVGIWLDGNSDNNIIGGILPGQANDLSYCSNGNSCDGNGGSAIRIRSAEAQGNTIRGNIMQCAQGAGIRLLSTGSNNNQPSPTISAFNTTTNILTGTTTTPNAIIDVYLGSDCNGDFTTNIKSKQYLASTTANASGNWTVNLSSFTCSLNGEYVTATATNPTNGSTGPFASGLLITIPTPAVFYPPGTYTVGPTGTFCSLKGVAAFLNLFTISGAYIFELQPTYNGSIEATPIVFNNNAGSSASNTVTIRPAAGATNLMITNGTSNNTIRLNGMDFLTFDGRAGGTGSSRNLSIETNNNLGAAIMLTNDALNNTIRFCNVRGGASTNGAGGSSGGMLGIIEINTNTAGTTGCDNNTISNCLIANNNSSTLTPISGIYCRGNSIARTNNNIVIRNNEFNGIREYGYNGANKYSGIIHFDAFNSDAVIEGNSIYQSAPYDIPLQAASQSVTQYGIFVHTGSGYSLSGTSVTNLTGNGNNFIIRDNFIGGSGPGCTGTWTVNAPTTSSGQYRFIGIYVQGTTSAPAGSLATIEGNTIKNFSWGTTAPFTNTAPQLAVWGGIVVVGGQNVGTTGRTVTIGTINKPNIIGDNTGNSITVTNARTPTGTGQNIIGIQVQGMGSGNATIEYNQIGGITASSTNGAGVVSSIEGIRVDDGNNIIRFNTIGSTTASNSFNITASSTTHNASVNNNQIQRVRGIVHTGGTATATSTTIANNTIANLRMNYAPTAPGPGAARGIVFENLTPANVRGAIQIQNNTIFNLTSNQNFAASGASANVVGIDFNLSGNSETAITDISGNTIHGLTTNGSSAITNAVGIYYSGRSAGTQTINGNFIRDFNSTNVNQSQTGIEAAGGVATYSNNIVYLGRNGSADINTHNIFNGISETGGTNQFYFNTATLGGTATVAGLNNTFAFITTVNAGTRNIRNNIFFNARSNSAGTSKHYAISLPGNTGLTINNNNYFISGTGGVLGRYNGVDKATLVAWQTSTAQDALSQFINPSFTANILNGTGTSTATNYRPTGAGIIAGAAIASVTTDYSGTQRTCNNSLGAFEIAPTAPNLQISNPAAVCSPNTVNLNAVGVITDLNSTTGTTTYFTSLANAISNTSPTAITTPVSTSGTYFIRKTAGCGYDVKPVTVIINPLPTPTFTVSSSNICAGSTGVVFTTQSGMLSYTWNISGTGNSITSGSATNSILTAWGSNGGNVTLNYTDPNGCSAASAISQAVTITPLAAPTFTATGASPVCQGVTGQTFTTQGSRSNYLWSVVGGTITAGGGSGNNSATITWNTPGTGIVAVNYSNAASPLCFANSYTSANITVNAPPAITVQPTAPTVVCSGAGTQTLSVTATGAGLNYSWRRGGTAVTNGGVFSGQGTNTLTLTNPTAANAGNYDVVITGTCTPSVTSSAVTVSVNPLPQGSISGNTVCLGGQSQFTFTASSGTGPYTLIIDGNTYNNVVSGTAFNGPSPSATTSYTLTSITDANGCVRTSGITGASATLTINTAPAITTQPTTPSATCNGVGTQTLSVVATGTGLTYSWRKGGVAVTNGSVFSGQGTNTLTLTNPQLADAGSYDVVISGTCPSAVTSNAVTVSINPLPQGSISGSTICLSNQGTFTFTATTGTGPYSLIIEGSTYNNVISGTPFNGTSPGSTTPYTLTSITDANTCVRTTGITGSSATITVNTAPSITTQAVQPTATCTGAGTQTISVTATGTGLTYSWRKDGLAVANGGVYSGQGTNTLTITNPLVADAGSYDVEISGTCTPSVTSSAVGVNVSAIPTASGLGSIETCENAPITVTGASATNGTIAWSIVNGFGTLANTGTITPTYTPVAADAGTTVVLRLTVSNPPCADAIYDQQIQVRPRPVLSPAAVNICTGNPFQQIDVVSPQPNSDYKWSPANDLYLDAGLTIPYTLGTPASTVWTAPFGNVTYNVTATNTTDNCVTGTTQVVVTVCPAANDAICQATAVNVTSSATFVNYSLTGSTPSIFAACAPVARDIYFSAIVPANGEIDVVTLPGTNANNSLNMVSSVVQILTGTCTSPTVAVCNSNGGSGNMSFANASGLTPGATVYIRLARTGGPTTAQFVRMAVTNGLVWTAAVDDDFNNPANWHGGDATAITVPGTSVSAIIPATIVRPKLNNNSTVRDVTFTTVPPYFGSQGVNLNGFTLNVKGNWLVGPSIASSLSLDCNGTVEFNGSGPLTQTIGGKNIFGNLTTNNTVAGVTLNNSTGVNCILQTTAGNLNSGGFLTLRSNNGLTALVNPLSGNVTGNVTVERKIDGPSGYHYLSGAVSGAIVNNTVNGWRDDFTILSSLDGITFIPGNIYTQLPTVWEYNESNTNPNPDFGWISATGTDDAITPLKGFACIAWNNTVVDVSGPLNNGIIAGGYNITKTAGTGVGEGINLIGNPYPSPISWNLFRSLPANNSLLATSGYKVFISSGGYNGAYGSWDGTIGSPASVTDRIASSQGIVVTALATGNINAANSARLTTSADVSSTFFSGYNSVPDLLRMEIQGNGFANETAIYFDGTAADAADINRDATLIFSPTDGMPNVYSYINQTPLNINVMGSLNSEKVVPLGVKIKTAGTYNLVATDMSSFSPSVIAYLEDTQTGSIINLRNTPSYQINLPVGEINNRFFLHFHPAVVLDPINETCAGNDGKLQIHYPSSNSVTMVIKDENGNFVYTQNNFSGSAIINNLAAGNYVAEMSFGVAPNTYTAVDYFSIAEGNDVAAQITASAFSVDMNANTSVNFTATAQGATSFNWNFGDGHILNNGPANVSHTFTQAGTYEVTFEASNGICNAVAGTIIEVTNTTGLTAISNSNLKVSAVGSKVSVRFGNNIDGTATIEIINMLGEVVAQTQNVAMKGTREIDLPNIAAGHYLVKIYNNNKLFTEKVYLNRQ
jgi:hypothetical protein